MEVGNADNSSEAFQFRIGGIIYIRETTLNEGRRKTKTITIRFRNRATSKMTGNE